MFSSAGGMGILTLGPERSCSKETSFTLFNAGFPVPHPESSSILQNILG